MTTATTPPQYALQQPVACTRDHQRVCRTNEVFTYLVRVLAQPHETPSAEYVLATPHGLVFSSPESTLRDLSDEELGELRDLEGQARTTKKTFYGGVAGLAQALGKPLP